MKINNSVTGPLSALGGPSSAVPASKSGGASAPEASPLSTDRVQLSNLSATLASAVGDSAAHLKKLTNLSALALNGAYHVDAGAVSDSIIRDSLQFGGAKYL